MEFPPTPVFFIKTEFHPLASCLESSISVNHSILVGAPDQDKAEAWAYQTLINHSKRKLSKLIVLPIYDSLLTHEGSQKIDWATFPSQIDRVSHEKYSIGDFISGGGICLQNVKELPKGWDNMDTLKKQVATSEKFNWDEGKQFYFVAFSDSDAFIVKSMNSIMCYIALIKNLRDKPQYQEEFEVRPVSEIKTYAH